MWYEGHATDDPVPPGRPGGGPVVLPADSARTGRKDLTQHHLFAVLALETFLRTVRPGRWLGPPPGPRAGHGAPVLDPVPRRAAAPEKRGPGPSGPGPTPAG